MAPLVSSSSEAVKSWKRPANAMSAPLLRVKEEPGTSATPHPAKKSKALVSSTPMPKETDGLTLRKRTLPTVYSGKSKASISDVNQTTPRLPELLQRSARCSYAEAAPTIQRCTAQQLERVEKLNPHWRPHTESLWQKLCAKDFKTSECEPGDGQSWRACYQRHVIDRDDKLAAFRAKFYKKVIG
uniref:GcrA cell cycle regulator n=1 Tax=Panagrellus redivivus TaxID=6233 RepID=A0A7E4UY10_PANRE